MKFFASAGAVLLACIVAPTHAVDLDPENEASIRNAAKKYADGLMSLYKGNAPGVAVEDVGIWPPPYYWWEGGASWGGMIEYSQFTGDGSYVKSLQQALTANYGPNHDFILSYRKSQTGNDDQAFWALAVMSALEYQFPDPDDAPAAYLDVAISAFENIVGRWDTTSCGGGLKWQIYPENAYGYNYKNSISNGCAFALGARLARYTGEQKYADWAVKIYDWSKQVGLISDAFEVFDGTDDKSNCAAVADKTQWTYNNAVYLHGSAFMFDFTNGASIWKDRTAGFLQGATLFFKPDDNATDIMYETACETGVTGRHCNLDQQSFKAYLARFLAKTAVMAPFTKDTVTKYLKASAVGAAKSCSGGANGATCGSKWYTGGWDGTSGVGQQLSALEVTQALLMLKKGTLPGKKSGGSAPKPSASKSSALKPSAPISVSSTHIAPSPSAVVSSVAVSSAPPKVPDAMRIPKVDPISSASSSICSAVPTKSGGGGVYANVPTKSLCISSVTNTVYVTASPSSLISAPTPVASGGSLDSSVKAPALADNSLHTRTSSPKHPGTASGVGVTLVSVLGAAVVATVFGML